MEKRSNDIFGVSMQKRLLIIAIALLLYRISALSQPICDITYYDEFSGLSQRLVKQVVQDRYGILWFATWNGLNRYDGYDFETIKMQKNSDTRVCSNRVNDIKLMSTGDLLCRIDNRCLVFDVRTHRFTDIHAAIEHRIGRSIEVRKLSTTTDGRSVLDCDDGSYVMINDADPAGSAIICDSVPQELFPRPSNLSYPGIGGFVSKELIYTGIDRFGTIWVVTRGGDIFYTSSPETPLTRYEEKIELNKRLFYSLTDAQGNVWLKCEQGVVKLVFGHHPYGLLPQSIGAEVRGICLDSKGRIWVSGREDRTLRLLDADMNSIGYIDGKGHLSKSYTSFGAVAYCIYEDREGNIWVGTKPDGLFRLRERAPGMFEVTQWRHSDSDPTSISADNVYDICGDGRGRLWIATMRGGINCVEDVNAATPVFINNNNRLRDYPQEASSVRRLIIVRDSVLLAATTGGLVVADIGASGGRGKQMPTFRLHIGDARHPASLSNISLMDVLEDSSGRIFIATESDGVSQIVSNDLLVSNLDFENLYSDGRIPEDVIYSMVENAGKLWVVSDNSLVMYSPDEDISSVYGSNYWKSRLRFSECKPLHIGGGRWLFGMVGGTSAGAILVNLDNMEDERYVPPIVLTAISVENHCNILAVNAMDTLILRPDERNLTVHFAALDYADASKISYAYRLGDDSPWVFIGTARSATLLKMSPGEYKLMIRSTDNAGRWQENTRVLTIIVKPQPWETLWAKAIYVLLFIIVVFIIAYIVLYIRTIKRRQKETLEAYMKLLDERTRQQTSREESRKDGNSVIPDPVAEGLSPVLGLRLTDEQSSFMKRVMDYVEANVHVAELNINDIAAAAAVSPSSLNRKMKQIVNVTPAEFVREMRIQRASTMLATTDRAVTDIALDCGFSDQNYFSKFFKAKKGMTPTEYRNKASTAL